MNPYGITLNVKFGSVTPLNNQAYASFSVNADGSMVFNTSPFENAQRIYLYNVQGYGNGTLTLKWNMGTLPSQVLAPGSSSTSLSGGPVVETITYTANALNVLEIDFTPLVSTQIANAIVSASFFWSIFYVAMGSLFSFLGFGNIIFRFGGQPPKLSFVQAFKYSAITIFGWTVLVLVAVGVFAFLQGSGH